MPAQAPTTRPTLPDIPRREASTTDGVGYETGYGYNLSGALVEQRYPSGRVVKNVLDASGDLSVVQSARCMDAAAGTGAGCTAQAGLWNYARHFTYNAAGAVTSMQLGNGRWESTVFNSRLQPVQIALGSTGTGAQAHDLLKLDYGYGGVNNNGNVLSQTITVQSVTIGGTTHNGFTAVQSYNYDALNRLDDAAEHIDGSPTPSWRQDFSYDRYGNRNFDEANTTFGGFEKLCSNGTELCAELRKIMNPSVSPSDNRLSSSDDYAFDTSGNTTEDPQGRTFIYDAENKQVEVRDAQQNIIGQYRYDGDGRRIKKHVPSTGEVTVFVYDASGKSIAEYSTQTAQDPKVSYTTSDHLGSPRILTDENGTVISRRDFHPFGEEISTDERNSTLGYRSDDVRQKFTTYEHDEETHLEFAQARMFSSHFARFSSPDPTLLSVNAHAPQSWNRYVYVLNNPYRYTDPLGLWAISVIVRDKLDENGEVVKDKKGRIVRESVITAVKTDKEDDAAKLAKQLGLTGGAAKKFVGQVGDSTTVRLSEMKGSIGSAFTFFEGRLNAQLKWERENSHRLEELAKEDIYGDNDNNCAGTTALLGLNVDVPNMGPEDLNSLVRDPLQASKASGQREFLDMLRYSSNGSATHWVNFIFENDDGTPMVFSKNGNDGPYQIRSARSLEGNPYGKMDGWFRGRNPRF